MYKRGSHTAHRRVLVLERRLLTPKYQHAPPRRLQRTRIDLPHLRTATATRPAAGRALGRDPAEWRRLARPLEVKVGAEGVERAVVPQLRERNVQALPGAVKRGLAR